MAVISLLTDFGLKDGFAGIMKGVILGIAPQAQIIDISHEISPQNIPEAALILFRAAPYFPAGTVHTVVVDPGVGTLRRPLAAQIGNQFFVGPDNGCITTWLELARQTGQETAFYHLTRPEFWLPAVSTVFHGRDIFAPVAAHLAAGTPLPALGEPISDPVLLRLPQPQPTPNGLRGEVIHIDHFGNLACNIRLEHLHRPVQEVQVEVHTIEGLVDAFGERPAGSLVALLGSTGNLVISVVNGSAASRLNARPGDPVEVSFA